MRIDESEQIGLFEAGLAYIEEGDLTSAWLMATILETTGNVNGIDLLIRLMFEEGDLEGARAQIEEGQRMAPDHAVFWHHLGVLYGYEGQHDLSVSAYKKVLELNGESENAWFSVGSACFRNRDWDQMEAAFKKIQSDEQLLHRADICRIAALLEQGRHEEVKEASARFLEENTLFFESDPSGICCISLYLCKVALYAGDYPEAERCRRTALRAWKYHPLTIELVRLLDGRESLNTRRWYLQVEIDKDSDQENIHFETYYVKAAKSADAFEYVKMYNPFEDERVALISEVQEDGEFEGADGIWFVSPGIMLPETDYESPNESGLVLVRRR